MMSTATRQAPLPGPQLFPRVIVDWDEKGFPLLAHECPQPKCGALALILNEWDAIECLTCSWREFGPDSPRADDSKWPDESCADDSGDSDDSEWAEYTPALVTVTLGALGRSVL